MKQLVVLTAMTLLVAGMVRGQTSPSTAPTDPQIAMIAVTADNVDIDAAKLAADKTKNPKVKDFANLMIRDHTSVNKKATALAKKLKITPEESDTSRSLKSDGDKNLEKLRGMSGAEFDKAYIDNEVSYHEAVAKVVDDTLIPNAKNAELKSLLESAKPVFASHLTHAKELQSDRKSVV